LNLEPGRISGNSVKQLKQATSQRSETRWIHSKNGSEGWQLFSIYGDVPLGVLTWFYSIYLLHGKDVYSDEASTTDAGYWPLLQDCIHYFSLEATELNTLDAELNPICHLLTLLGAHHILHVSRI